MANSGTISIKYAYWLSRGSFPPTNRDNLRGYVSKTKIHEWHKMHNIDADFPTREKIGKFTKLSIDLCLLLGCTDMDIGTNMGIGTTQRHKQFLKNYNTKWQVRYRYDMIQHGYDTGMTAQMKCLYILGLLCNSKKETMLHLFTICPLTKDLCFNSQGR